ncbi:MAG: type II toxin-antitoxin system VapC family toxin [Methylomonas sp.]|jgi:predicted nucleic acid-binding protein
MLLDSNIFIYANLPEYKSLRQWLMNHSLYASEITRLEVLGYHKLNEADKLDFQQLFQVVTVYPISSSIIDLAINLRQGRKISLGDSIIAATGLERRKTLLTRNVKDFDWVEGLKVIDPLATQPI